MSRYVANVDILTETFQSWLLKTNTLLDAVSLEVITANTTYANTGNTTAPRIAQLYGTFGANVMVSSDSLRGGNVASSANLNITSNTIITGVTLTSTANSLYTNTAYFTANVNANGAQLTVTSNVAINSTSTIIQGSNIQLNSNTLITALSVAGNSTATNTTIGGTALNISANVAVTGINHTFNGNVNFDTATVFIDSVNNRLGIGTAAPAAALDTVGTANVSGNTYIGGRLSVAGATSVSNTLAAGNTTLTGTLEVTAAANLQSSANVGGAFKAVGAANLMSTVGITGAATLANTISVTGATTLSNTLTVTGSTTSNTLLINNTAVISGTLTISNTFTQQSDYFVEVVSNTDIGSNTTAPQKIYSFPIASYNGGKLMVKVTATGNTQMSEMVIAHDGTTPYFSVYGTVASPPGGTSADPLGSFTCIINNTSSSVELYLQQTITHSATKVVAHLIK